MNNSKRAKISEFVRCPTRQTSRTNRRPENRLKYNIIKQKNWATNAVPSIRAYVTKRVVTVATARPIMGNVTSARNRKYTTYRNATGGERNHGHR